MVMRGFIIAMTERISKVSKIEIAITFAILYLPQLFLAFSSTVDLTKKNSLKILISHPSLLLLPMFTFFTFSKLQCCGDRRVKFSKRFTLINIAISVAGIITCLVWNSDQLVAIKTFTITLVITSATTILGILSTVIFLYLDTLCCCCCGCFLSATETLRVFDPDQPERNFIMEDGRVVEVTDEDDDYPENEGNDIDHVSEGVNEIHDDDQLPEEDISLDTFVKEKHDVGLVIVVSKIVDTDNSNECSDY